MGDQPGFPGQAPPNSPTRQVKEHRCKRRRISEPEDTQSFHSLVPISPESFKFKLPVAFFLVLNDPKLTVVSHQVTVAPPRCKDHRRHSRRIHSKRNCVSWCSPVLPGRLLHVRVLAPRLFLTPPSKAGRSCWEYLSAHWKKSPQIPAGRWDRGAEDRGNHVAYCKTPSQPRSFETPGDVPSTPADVPSIPAAIFQHRLGPGSLSVGRSAASMCYSLTNTRIPGTEGARCPEMPLRGGNLTPGDHRDLERRPYSFRNHYIKRKKLKTATHTPDLTTFLTVPKSYR